MCAAVTAVPSDSIAIPRVGRSSFLYNTPVVQKIRPLSFVVAPTKPNATGRGARVWAPRRAMPRARYSAAAETEAQSSKSTTTQVRVSGHRPRRDFSPRRQSGCSASRTLHRVWPCGGRSKLFLDSSRRVLRRRSAAGAGTPRALCSRQAFAARRPSSSYEWRAGAKCASLPLLAASFPKARPQLRCPRRTGRSGP